MIRFDASDAALGQVSRELRLGAFQNRLPGTLQASPGDFPAHRRLGHASGWKRARKIIQPTAEGFDERLEVDAGQGFVPYYTIPMRKLT
jgi:hypothetical protein